MKDNETWFEFMNRAKKNGLSPISQEATDNEEDGDERIAPKT